MTFMTPHYSNYDTYPPLKTTPMIRVFVCVCVYCITLCVCLFQASGPTLLGPIRLTPSVAGTSRPAGGAGDKSQPPPAPTHPSVKTSGAREKGMAANSTVGQTNETQTRFR